MTYSGVFILSDMVARDLNGEGQPLNTVFTQRPFDSSAGPNTGYFAGGPSTTVVDKVNYTNDTTARVPTADLPTAQDDGNASSSLTAGYFAGGNPGQSEVNKLTYAADTTARVPTADLSDPRHGLAGTGGSSSGYFVAGYSNPAGGVVTITDKLTYSTDTTARAPSADVSVARYYMEGTGDSSNGYIAGGYAPGPDATKSVLDKIAFSADVAARVPGGNLSLARYGLAATGNQTAGYFSGGINPGGGKSTTDKCTYSSETMAEVPGAAMSSARYYVAGTSSSTAGYLGGGLQTTARTTMDKLNYSTDGTAAVPGADLTGSGNRNGFATSAKANAIPFTTNPTQQFTTGIQPGPYVGYSVNGTTPAATQSTVDKLDLATDTSAATTNFVRSGNNAGNLSKVDAGYYCGGSSPEVSLVSKLTFSTDTSAAVSGNITAARYGIGAAGNNTFGYLFAGRNSGTVYTTVDKMTYSTETTAAVSTAALTATVYGARAMGNGGVGYVMGGFVPPSWPGPTTIQKITYSTDTREVIPGTITDVGGRYLAGVANKEDFGYLMGGGTGSGLISSTDKFSLTSETSSLAPAASELSLVKSAQSAYSNGSTDAYNCGGSNPGGSANYSTCEKITYQTDTRAVVPGGAMSSTRYQVMGFSPRQFTLPNPPIPTPTPQTFSTPTDDTALVGGGYNPGASPSRLTSFQKMNLSTETVSNSTAEFSFGNHNGGSATGNGTYAFFTSGVNDSTSATERVTFATEAIQRIPGMNTINSTVYGSTPVGNTSVGYMMGGAPPNRSYVQKLDFSAESLSAVPGANMPGPRRYGHSAATPAFGYAIQGQDQTPTPDTFYTDAVKLTYSNETSATIPAGTIPTNTGPVGGGSGVSGPAHAYVPLNISPLSSSTTIYKFTFSTETAAASPSSELLTPGTRAAGAGDHTAGYFFGGQVWGGSPAAETNINKITYSNDTCSTSPGKLSPARTAGNARSMSMNGMPTATVTNPVNC